MSCDKSATPDDSSVTNDSRRCRITVMENTELPKKPGRAALSGWSWMAAWSFLVGALTLVIRGVVEFTATGFWREVPWIVSFVVAFAIVLLIGIAVKCFTSWRNFRILLIAVACLAGLIVLFYAEEDLRGRVSWNRFKADWEKKGERFDFALFIPPAVPDEKNFATAPIVATSYEALLDRHGTRKVPEDTNVASLLIMPFDGGGDTPTNGFGNWRQSRPARLAEWQQYYRELSKTNNIFPVSPDPQTAAADVLLALSIYSNRVEELRLAAERPESRFPLNYDQEPYSILLPHLGSLRSSVALLRATALAELEAGQSQAALDDISLGLRLIDKIRSEPFLISPLVRIAMLQVMIQPIWEGLAQHQWDDRQLADLDRLLSAFDFVADYQAALRGETACNIAAIDYLRRHPGMAGDFINFLENDGDRAAQLISIFAPAGWFYQNQRTTAKFITENLVPIANPTNHTFSSAAVTNAEKALTQMPTGPYTALAKLILPAPVRLPYKFALAQDSVTLSQIACALERYRLAEHHFPQTLDALVPRYIAAIPNDAVSGQLPRYRIESDGSFVLYTVGQNGVDEGGLVVSKSNGLVDLEQGDIVWRYPETSPR